MRFNPKMIVGINLLCLSCFSVLFTYIKYCIFRVPIDYNTSVLLLRV